MSIIAALGFEDVHRGTIDTPKAKSKTMKFHMGDVPGMWTAVRGSLAIRNAHLNNEDRATALSTPKRPIAHKAAGPKSFSPCLVDITEHAEDSHDHTVDLASADGFAATHHKCTKAQR